MIDEKFIFAAVILNLAGGLSYLIDTLKGKVKPNKVSWLLWGIAPMIAFPLIKFKLGKKFPSVVK